MGEKQRLPQSLGSFGSTAGDAPAPGGEGASHPTSGPRFPPRTGPGGAQLSPVLPSQSCSGLSHICCPWQSHHSHSFRATLHIPSSHPAQTSARSRPQRVSLLPRGTTVCCFSASFFCLCRGRDGRHSRQRFVFRLRCSSFLTCVTASQQ